MKKILIIGSKAQLGSDLSKELKNKSSIEIVALDHTQIELRDKSPVHKSITEPRPDIVINCGAYVRVDDCEENPPSHAIEVNALGAGFVAQASAEIGAVCVYISTDF
ncbi:MAG: sugar nucleotide-binding protein [Deltaproteobacteria bacterium]|nr:sugar nucleotide-binding protein [Deltaproteobacteria bacterium]